MIVKKPGMATDERVLCFERRLFDKLGVFQGMSLDVGKYLPALTVSSNVLYLNRSQVEHDQQYKQLIPYAIIVCGEKVLRYRRGKRGVENRLHGLFSIGIGGHISEEDNWLFSRAQGYHEAMRRTLKEKLSLDLSREVAVAVINDDNTDVGSVHLGVVHIVNVANESLANGRLGVVHPEFVRMAEAVKNPEAYETWSRFCLAHLDALLSKAAALAPDCAEAMHRRADDASSMVLQILERQAAFGF